MKVNARRFRCRWYVTRYARMQRGPACAIMTGSSDIGSIQAQQDSDAALPDDETTSYQRSSNHKSTRRKRMNSVSRQPVQLTPLWEYVVSLWGCVVWNLKITRCRIHLECEIEDCHAYWKISDPITLDRKIVFRRRQNVFDIK